MEWHGPIAANNYSVHYLAIKRGVGGSRFHGCQDLRRTLIVVFSSVAYSRILLSPCIIHGLAHPS